MALRLVNDSSDPKIEVAGRKRGTTTERHDDDRDHFVFRNRISVTAQPGLLQPIRMNLGPDAYRYNPDLEAYASNCGVESVLEDNQIVQLHSVWAPRYKTYRIESRPDPSTDFGLLESKPIETLEQLAAMARRLQQRPRRGASMVCPPDQAEVKRRDLAAFREETRRFRTGLVWLRRDPRLLLAFRLMNRTMIKLGEMSGRPFSGWYLFQLVFIVSQLAALAWREHPPEEFETVDGTSDPTSVASVLWFPTGGGKTEALPGIKCLRNVFTTGRAGKKTGVTAWCRLPLRLLTLQATQRQVALVAAADEVRSAASNEIVAVGGHPGHPFRVGLLMGESNTPNSISRDANTVRVLRDDEERRNRFRVVDKCPYCRARAVTVVAPDTTSLRLIH